MANLSLPGRISIRDAWNLLTDLLTHSVNKHSLLSQLGLGPGPGARMLREVTWVPTRRTTDLSHSVVLKGDLPGKEREREDSEVRQLRYKCRLSSSLAGEAG